MFSHLSGGGLQPAEPSGRGGSRQRCIDRFKEVIQVVEKSLLSNPRMV